MPKDPKRPSEEHAQDGPRPVLAFDPEAVDAAGDLAWMIADEFINVFDQLLLEMAEPDPEIAKTAGRS